MNKVDVTVEICGTSGDGTIAAGGMLNEAMSAIGFSVLGFDSYPAEIRGFGRCVTRSRIGTSEILALEEIANVLISLDDIQSQSRLSYLTHDSIVFFDNNPPTYTKEENSLASKVDPGVLLYGIPFADLASGVSGSARGKNLAALGGFASVFGLSRDPFHHVITRKFKSKGDKVVDANLKSFDAGYDYAKNNFSDRKQTISLPEKRDRKYEMVVGNAAVGQAATDAKLKLYFGYPITPATTIMEYLAKHLPPSGGKVIQMEDEISSIGAVLGSYFAGARAMTATSGPGFALMTELIGHGVMTETPAVVINVQRGGPSTGLPTKTEQSDLNAAIFGGPGDSIRIVVAPTNIRESYTYTLKSFQWAEKFQTPVVLLTDFYLANRVESLPIFEPGPEQIKDCNVYPDPIERETYVRYEATDSGISPRSIPGMEGFQFVTTGLEHVEKGTPNYSAANHSLMSEKRFRKIKGCLKDLPEPEEFCDSQQLDIGVIGWGSTFGSVLEAVNICRNRGERIGALKIISLFPYHEDKIRGFTRRCRTLLIPELNFQGQLANLISHLYSGKIHRLNRATGIPIPPSEILREIELIQKSELS